MLTCEWCKKEYIKPRSHHKTRFCSQSCATKKQYAEGRVAPTILARKGWKGVRNTGRTRFKKGQKPWNEDTKGLVKANSGSFKKGQFADENHPFWKGDNVKYYALHSWIARKLGKPTKCEHCGKDGLKGKYINWANKSQEYKRDLDDWLRLCRPCHSQYDNMPQRISIARKKQIYDSTL